MSPINKRATGNRGCKNQQQQKYTLDNTFKKIYLQLTQHIYTYYAHRYSTSYSNRNSLIFGSRFGDQNPQASYIFWLVWRQVKKTVVTFLALVYNFNLIWQSVKVWFVILGFLA